MRANELLKDCRVVLSQMLRLHLDSVVIGQCQHLSETGIIRAEMKSAARIIEQADLLCAEIDKLNQNQGA